MNLYLKVAILIALVTFLACRGVERASIFVLIVVFGREDPVIELSVIHLIRVPLSIVIILLSVWLLFKSKGRKNDNP
jgi:hypothetical protein